MESTNLGYIVEEQKRLIFGAFSFLCIILQNMKEPISLLQKVDYIAPEMGVFTLRPLEPCLNGSIGQWNDDNNGFAF